MTLPRAPSVRLARNLLLQGELTQIARAFGREQIEFVLLKGIPLARRLYGRLDARAMVDNDFLVRRADVHRAVATLRAMGYVHRDLHTLEGDLRVDFETTLQRRIGSSTLIEADLHWNAFAPDVFQVDETMLFARTEEFELCGERLRVFDPLLTVLHLAAHFMRNQLSDPKTLRDLGTAWTLWRNSIDSAELVSIACAAGIQHALEYGLCAAWDLGLTRQPPLLAGSQQARLMRRILPSRRLLVPRARADTTRRLLAMLLVDPPRLPARLRAVLLPKAETLTVIYGKPVSNLLYLRYLMRLFRPLKRAVTSVTRSGARWQRPMSDGRSRGDDGRTQ